MFSQMPAHARLKKSLPTSQIQVGKQKANFNRISQSDFLEQVDRLIKESEEIITKEVNQNPQKQMKRISIIEDEEEVQDNFNTINCQKLLNRAIQDDDDDLNKIYKSYLIDSSDNEENKQKRKSLKQKGEFIRNLNKQQDQEKLRAFQEQYMNKNSNQKISKRLKKKIDCELQVAQDDPSLCSICLNNFKDQDVAVISCKHIYCFDCIKNYGEQYSNQCPLCRKIFTHLNRGKQMTDGDFQKIEQVQLKLKQEVEESQLESDEYDDSFIDDGEIEYFSDDDQSVYEDCEVCGCGEDSLELLSCKMCGKRKCHSYCVLESGQNLQDWGCSVCYY